MVVNVPHVDVSQIPGNVSNVLNTEQTMACVFECKKGIPNTPVLISSPGQLKREFGISLDLYWAAGGGKFYGVRAVYGEVKQATHFILDNATSPMPVMKIELKKAGSKKSFITFLSSGAGAAQRLSITIEEEDGEIEYFLGVRKSLTANSDGVVKSTVQNMVEKINRESDIANAYLFAIPASGTVSNGRWTKTLSTGETVYLGSGSYTSIPRTILGSGTGNIAGLDGEQLKADADQRDFDIISDTILETGADAGLAPSEIAHANALKALEQVDIAGVFCLKGLPYTDRMQNSQISGTGDIYQQYVDHVTKMNTAEQHGWRFAILGASEEMNMVELLEQAGRFDSEAIIFVGQGLVDTNGVEYTGAQATQAVAGKIAATAYNISIWGGTANKVLRTNSVFITDYAEIPGEPVYQDPDATSPVIIGENVATRSDMIIYNESGVLTFLKDNDGVKITEGVTTAQSFFDTIGVGKEDEISVMRIINKAKREVYDACYQMLGQGLTDTFKTDLENTVRASLAIMAEEGALSAYDVSASVGDTTSSGEQGAISVDIAITPVHAARIITATIVVD